MKNKARVLSTAILGPSLINKALAEDIVVDELPFISIIPNPDQDLPGKINELLQRQVNVVFTSTNALNSVAEYGLGKNRWTIYCIGKATKTKAIELFGVDSIARTALNASGLADEMIEDGVKEAVFFCGDQRRDELPAKLMSNGIKVNEVVVYKTILTPTAIHHPYDAVLFFSPTAVESFFSVNTLTPSTLLFAIGKTTAEMLKPFTASTVLVCENPGREEMIQQLIAYYKERGD